jgi:hypothetical protein
VVAQHQNLGDVVIRREMIKYLSGCGQVHVLGGDSPTDYISALALPADRRVYRSRMAWLGCLVWSALVGRALLAYSPGPQSLRDRPREIVGEISRLALTCSMRMLGVSVVRLGRSFEGNGRVMRRIVRLHSRALALSVSRDSRLELPGPRSISLPDLAVAAGSRELEFGGTYLSVSLRYDRSVDLPAFAASIQRLAAELDLKPLVVTQVTFDVARNAHLAALLESDHVGAEGNTSERLESVSRAYRESALVLSDRLHALIFGLTHGAIPWHLETGSGAKLRASLDEIGVSAPMSMGCALTMSMDELTALRCCVGSELHYARQRLEVLPRLLEHAVSAG